jgi:hypothetical protein
METNKTKDKEHSQDDTLALAAMGILTFLIISFPLNDFLFSLKFMFVYFSIFYLPFILLVNKIQSIGLIEKFILIMLAGLTYSGIYIFFDIFLKIPLTRILFVAISLIILVLGFGFYWFKR